MWRWSWKRKPAAPAAVATLVQPEPEPLPSTPPRPTRRLFHAQADQDFFAQAGYVIHDFLQADEVEQLNQLFDRTVRQGRDTYEFLQHLRYYISVFDKDVSKRRVVDHAIKEIFYDKMERFMIDHRILLCNFMAKEPNGKGEIQVHQDFTFVDEEHYTGFNLWVPLQDTHVHNGGLALLPGSNAILPSYRAASIPDTLTAYNETLKHYMTPQTIPAGQGILFDHRLFHYSPDNHSEQWRAAVQLVIVPKEAQVVLAYYDRAQDPEHVTLYKIDDDYLIDHSMWEPPQNLEVFGKKPYIPLPSEEDMVRRVEAHISQGAAAAQRATVSV